MNIRGIKRGAQGSLEKEVMTTATACTTATATATCLGARSWVPLAGELAANIRREDSFPGVRIRVMEQYAPTDPEENGSIGVLWEGECLSQFRQRFPGVAPEGAWDEYTHHTFRWLEVSTPGFVEIRRGRSYRVEYSSCLVVEANGEYLEDFEDLPWPVGAVAWGEFERWYISQG